MIKILKPGRDLKNYAITYKKTCQRCGCEFEFEESDCDSVEREKRLGGAIWYTPLTSECVETENKAEKEDVIFYADPHEKNCAVLNSGDFAIFFPWELHRPNCSVEKIANNVQKIVVKVKA